LGKDRAERRTSPWEWRLVNWVSAIIVAGWLGFGFLLPPSVHVPVNGLAALMFGAVQFVWGWILLLNISRLADRMASDSRGRRTMGRGFFVNHYPLVWRIQGVIPIVVGALLLSISPGLLFR